MIKTNLKLLLMFMFYLVPMHLFAQYNVKADENTVSFLKKFREDFKKSKIENKPELLEGYYAKNIRLMPEFQKTIIGNNNALSYHKAFSKRFKTNDLRINETEILDLGSSIAEFGNFNMKIMLLDTIHQEFSLEGKYLNIWEKHDDGKLALITQAWNYNHSTDLARNLIFDEVPVVNIALQPHLSIKNNISFELAALNKLQEVIITQHDASIWSQFFTDDCMFLYSNHPIIEGRKSIDDFLNAHVKELPIFEKLDIRNDQIDHLGNFVIEYASHIAVWRGGTFSGINTGKDLRIWRREPDGSLKIFRQMAMYD